VDIHELLAILDLAAVNSARTSTIAACAAVNSPRRATTSPASSSYEAGTCPGTAQRYEPDTRSPTTKIIPAFHTIMGESLTDPRHLTSYSLAM
jgi:hypothetical protein